MDRQQIKSDFHDEIVELAYLLTGTFPQAKWHYEVQRDWLIREYGYGTFFDIQSCAFEYMLSA